jgi:hypothetical protein
MAFWKENDMKRFGVLLASAALGAAVAATGPALAFGGGHGGRFGGGHMGGGFAGSFHGGGGGFGGRSMAMGGFNRGFGFNHGCNSRFAPFDHFHHFRNFVGGGWDWGYPYYDYAV